MSVNIIAAYGRNKELGQNNDLLWKMGEMKKDMAHFRELTLGSSVIMGRNTFESLGSKALTDRYNVVLTRDGELETDDVAVAHTIREALVKARQQSRTVNVIGGAAVYSEMIHIADKMYITEVDADFPDADVHFPHINSLLWGESSREEFSADADNIYPFDFVEYERVS